MATYKTIYFINILITNKIVNYYLVTIHVH